MERAVQQRIVGRLLLLSFGLSALLGLVLLVAVGGPLIAGGTIAALLGVHLLFRAFARAGLPIGWFVALALVNLLLVVPELGLRIADFRHGAKIEFGYPAPSDFQHLAHDDELFWKHPPGGGEYNSWGFRGREVQIPKPEGTFRILFLGDSCTAIGRPTNYPTMVEERLNAARGPDDPAVEVVNLSVPGYSSYQGRVIAERHGRDLGADLVFVYYGWNDHWQAYGAIDDEKEYAPTPGWLEWANQKFRLLHATRWLKSRMRGGSGAIDQVRVPTAYYRRNLEQILAVFREQGVPTVFLTAPTTFYTHGVPDYLVEEAFVADAEQAIARHREYAAITREVAGLDGALLLDLEARYSELEEVASYFLHDAIHFTPEGRRKVADDIVAFIEALDERD